MTYMHVARVIDIAITMRCAMETLSQAYLIS